MNLSCHHTAEHNCMHISCLHGSLTYMIWISYIISFYGIRHMEFTFSEHIMSSFRNNGPIQWVLGSSGKTFGCWCNSGLPWDPSNKPSWELKQNRRSRYCPTVPGNSYAGLGPSGFLMITYGIHWYVLQIHSPEIKQGKRKKPHTWPWTKKGLSRWPQSKDRVYKPEKSLDYTLSSIVTLLLRTRTIVWWIDSSLTILNPWYSGVSLRSTEQQSSSGRSKG